MRFTKLLISANDLLAEQRKLPTSGKPINPACLEYWMLIGAPKELGTFSPLHADLLKRNAENLTITFQWSGTLQTIEFDTPDEWINLAALAAVNNLIQHLGIQLYNYVSFDQGAYIVSLTAQEKLRLEQERGWKFATLRGCDSHS